MMKNFISTLFVFTLFIGFSFAQDSSVANETDVSACVLGTVYISEAHGKGDPEDYIEIFNSGDTDCSMLGFMLDDEQPFGDFTFGDVIIPAGAYWMGEEDAEGSFGSGIGGGGDNLYLGDTLGNVLMVESLDGDLGATNFTADGAGCSAEPTPGTLNAECTVFVEGCTDEAALNYNPDANLNTGCEYPVIVSSCVLGVVYISEAHGSGDPEDYIEIYNSGDTDCSMLGFMIDDEQPFDDFTFADVIIPAGAYWLGEEDAEGSFSSGIGSGGDHLYLGDTLGNVLTVESFNGDFGATNFTADGAGCSAEPSPGAVNTACTIFDQGCLDANASNYNPGAIEQEYDQWNNTLCTYSSCDDVPSEGCMYSDAFAAWNEWFNAADCSTYGGTPCELDPCGNACAYNEICVNGSCEEIIPVATGLPIVYINTENQTSIKVKTEGYVNGVVTVVGGESIKSGSMINGLDSQTMEIRGRGNSTWMHPKKPYQMKLEDKATFLDMPNDKKWLFLAEYSDKTMLRNTMAFEMGYASSLDWTPAGEFAEVYINGEYNGTYNITQKVEAKSNRVDIGDDGFLLEIDQIERIDADDHYVSTNEFPVINIKEPDINDIIEDDGVGKADSAVTKISTFINEFESVLFGDNFTDSLSGYGKYIDVESFIDWFLISEILKNVDSRNFSSIYFHVIFDENDQGKMKMGPLWDFDLSFGNTDYADSQYPEGWWVRNNPWISRLMNDPIFKEQVITRFEDHFYARKGIILDKINTYSNALAASAVQNDNQWGPYIGSYVWPNPNVGDLSTGNSGIQGYNDAVNNITDWYEQRMEWLKENFWSLEACTDANASNFEVTAITQTYDQWGNSTCIYASCDDIPDAEGCSYTDAYSPFHGGFNAEDCEQYGGTACTGGSVDVEGCVDANATNYDANANVQAQDQWGNSTCIYASCDDIPDAEGCSYASAYSPFNEGFNAANCVTYGGAACVDDTNITSVDVTFQVDMSAVDTHEEGVYLAGGDLGQDGYLMDHNGNDLWSITITLEPNRTYMYKFRNQPSYGSWDGFEAQAGLVAGGCSTGDWDDRFVEVVESDIVLDLVSYGSCTAGGFVDVSGCLDSNATNYNAAATDQAEDQWGNILCVYASCDDIPQLGCIYAESFGAFHESFDGAACSNYGGTPCEGGSSDV
ncbi:MAG: CotH kinase family protein, partial [Candidatus Marinimicrobia bacterium]|nr:CotH kinase family protein [Candidatus Neomarinimicrobiota bacterium]